MSPALNYARVAELYDSYARFDVDISFFFAECRGATGPLLELMARTGRVSIPLLEAGAQLTCVDSSPEVLSGAWHTDRPGVSGWTDGARMSQLP